MIPNFADSDIATCSKALHRRPVRVTRALGVTPVHAGPQGGRRAKATRCATIHRPGFPAPPPGLRATPRTGSPPPVPSGAPAPPPGRPSPICRAPRPRLEPTHLRIITAQDQRLPAGRGAAAALVGELLPAALARLDRSRGSECSPTTWTCTPSPITPPPTTPATTRSASPLAVLRHRPRRGRGDRPGDARPGHGAQDRRGTSRLRRPGRPYPGCGLRSWCRVSAAWPAVLAAARVRTPLRGRGPGSGA